MPEWQFLPRAAEWGGFWCTTCQHLVGPVEALWTDGKGSYWHLSLPVSGRQQAHVVRKLRPFEEVPKELIKG